ncbi:MAG: 2-hydroxyacyl-CoA dehydratase family protein [Candidatus Alcyoniella australis]|nr:2-hydroxyacyl-CoA dehydratase family protein [Candidatus Alcyoniella australis]
MNDKAAIPRIEATRKLKELMGIYYLEAKNAEYNNQKVAWVTSGSPVETLIAMDVIPIYPENHGAMIGVTRMGVELSEVAEGMGYSPDLCSYFRADVGQAATGNSPIAGLPKPDFLYCCDNICSTVVKWYEVQGRKYDAPVFWINTPFVPDEITPAHRSYVAGQLEQQAYAIAKLLGREFDMEHFIDVLRLSEQATRVWQECLNLCQHKPAPMSSIDSFFHMAPIVTLRGTQKCLDYYTMLRDELQDRIDKGIGTVPQEKHRLLWDNLPIWFWTKGLAELTNSLSAVFVVCTYTSSWDIGADTMLVDDPWQPMADTYLFPYINRGMEVRIRMLENWIKQFDVDGLVFHSNRSCKAYTLGQYELAKLVSERTGKPSLVIEGDMCDMRLFSEAQTVTRLEAFIESL